MKPFHKSMSCLPILAGIGWALACGGSTGRAALVGTNVSAEPLTASRVAALPEWKRYFERSLAQRQLDQAGLLSEMKASGLTNAVEPPRSDSPKQIPLTQPAHWYGTAEAARIARCVVSFQTPSGGWGKHTDFTRRLRRPGELFVGDHNAQLALTGKKQTPIVAHWNYVGTIDNDATTTELRFLAKVISAGQTDTAALQTAFEKGIRYLLAAQFPNGGWPQVWPLQGGYHDTVTLNDDAMINVMKLLREVANGQNEFSFVPDELRRQAGESWKRGLDCLLAAQIVANGHRTVWCQQHDAITLQPAPARNFEMIAQASAESANVVLFLMDLPNPNSNIVAAVHAAAAWFEKTKIEDKAFQRDAPDGSKLVNAPGHEPIWARFYEISSDRPLFGDRDKTIHDDVTDLSAERRQGYAWYGTFGKKLLEKYPQWAAQHPLNR